MSEFVICINNDSNRASLILGKVYRRLPDAEVEAHNMFRVVDEDKSELARRLTLPRIYVCANRATRSGKAGAISSGRLTAVTRVNSSSNG